MAVDTGETYYKYDVYDKGFAMIGSLKAHVVLHTRRRLLKTNILYYVEHIPQSLLVL